MKNISWTNAGWIIVGIEFIFILFIIGMLKTSRENCDELNRQNHVLHNQLIKVD